MTIKFKVVYKDTKGDYKEMRFSKLHCALTFAKGMDGIILNAK